MSDVSSDLPRTQQTPWRLHVGAHKTGTTYFQKLLESARHDARVQHDIDYIPLAVARPILHRARWESKRQGMRLPEERGASTFLELIQPFRHIGKVIALSEENLLGRAVDALSSPLYPNLESNLAFVEHMTQGSDRTIFVSIRSLADVVPGAFCTALRFLKVKPKQYQQMVPDCSQSWVTIVQRLEAVFPDAKIWVFRFEDLIENPKFFLDAFLGCNNVPPARIDIPRQTLRISTKAMDEIGKLNWDVPKPEWQRMVERISFENPVNTSNPKFTFLSQSEIDMFNAQYQTDCEILQKDGKLLVPRNGHAL